MKLQTIFQCRNLPSSIYFIHRNCFSISQTANNIIIVLFLLPSTDKLPTLSFQHHPCHHPVAVALAVPAVAARTPRSSSWTIGCTEVLRKHIATKIETRNGSAQTPTSRRTYRAPRRPSRPRSSPSTSCDPYKAARSSA